MFHHGGCCRGHKGHSYDATAQKRFYRASPKDRIAIKGVRNKKLLGIQNAVSEETILERAQTGVHANIILVIK